MFFFRSVLFNVFFMVLHAALVVGMLALLPFPRRWMQVTVRLWTNVLRAGLKLIVGLDLEHDDVELGGKMAGHTLGHQAPVCQDGESVTALRLVHVGGSHNHGQALRPEAVEHGPEMAPGQGVDAEPRFVKDQQLRFMDQIGT